jgi:hypothetical protein
MNQGSAHTFRGLCTLFWIAITLVGHNQAIGAVARKLCRLIWMILTLRKEELLMLRRHYSLV